MNVLLLDEATQTLRVAAHRGSAGPSEYQGPRDVGLSGIVATTRSPLCVPDVQRDPRTVLAEDARDRGIVTYLGLPIQTRDQLLGVLTFATTRPREYSGDEIAYLTSFAAQAAVAIANARLFAESERRRRRAESLADVGRLLSQSLDPAEVGHRIVESLRTLLDTEMAGLYRVGPGSEDLKLLAGAGPAVVWNHVLPKGTAAVGVAIEERVPVTTPDVLADRRISFTPEARARIDQSGYRAVLAVPLIAKDRIIGALAAGDRLGRTFDTEEVQLTQAFADQAALALENAQLVADLKTRQGRLTALLETTRWLSALQPLDSVLAKIAEACGRLLDSTSVGFRLVEGDDLVLTGTWGDAALAMPTRRLKIGESLSGLVAATGESLVVPRLADDPRLLPAHRDAVLRLGHEAWLGVPLKVGERLLGVLSVRAGHERTFSEEDVAVAVAFASQAAIAVENARLYSEVEQRLRQAETLLNVSHAVDGTFDLRESLRRVAREMACVLGADMVGAYLAEPDGSALRPLAGYHVPPDFLAAFRDVPIPLRGHGLIEEASERAQPVWSSDAETDPRIDRETWRRFPHRSVLLAPMLGRDRELIGGLFAIWREERHEFTPEEGRLAAGIGRQAALATAAARLLEESGRRRRAAEALAEVGQLISQSLDPAEVARRIVESVRALFEAEMAGLYRLHRETGDFELLGGIGPRVSWTKTFPKGTGTVGLAVCERRAVTTTNLLEDARITLTPESRQRLEQSGYRAVLAVPLVVQDEIIGALAVGDRLGRVFGADDVQLAQVFAAQAATALENARLYQAAQRAYEELSQAQERLTQAQKMEAIGRLAGGIAHDFNNLLSVIMGRSSLLLKRLPASSPMQRDLTLIHRTGERAAKLTRQLLAFSRKQILQPESLDLNGIVGEMESMLRRLIGEHIRFVARLEPSLGLIKADPGQIEQVIVNLAINARDAMPQGGSLTIETTAAEVAAGAATAPGLPPGRYVVLNAIDTGVGMDEATRSRIFEPFFTTKLPGQGTGLGLSTVYGIVQQSEGAITVESGPGRGSTFRVYLPRVDEPAKPAARPDAEPAPRGGETVLVVEDDDDVRALARDALVAQGYAVFEAATPDAAEHLSERYEGPIHLLVTDIVMPGMSGPELAERLARTRKEMKVLFMSGYTDDRVLLNGLLAEEKSYLPKPFNPDDLAWKVREVLGESRAVSASP